MEWHPSTGSCFRGDLPWIVNFGTSWRIVAEQAKQDAKSMAECGAMKRNLSKEKFMYVLGSDLFFLHLILTDRDSKWFLNFRLPCSYNVKKKFTDTMNTWKSDSKWLRLSYCNICDSYDMIAECGKICDGMTWLLSVAILWLFDMMAEWGNICEDMMW